MANITVYVAKLDRNVEIDFQSLPLASQEYIIHYGLTQSLNDKLAGFKATEMDDSAKRAEAESKLEERLDDLKAGRAPKGSGGGKRADVFEATLRELVADIGRKDGLPMKDLRAAMSANGHGAGLTIVLEERAKRLKKKLTAEQFQEKWTQAAENLARKARELIRLREKAADDDDIGI